MLHFAMKRRKFISKCNFMKFVCLRHAAGLKIGKQMGAERVQRNFKIFIVITLTFTLWRTAIKRNNTHAAMVVFTARKKRGGTPMCPTPLCCSVCCAPPMMRQRSAVALQALFKSLANGGDEACRRLGLRLHFLHESGKILRHYALVEGVEAGGFKLVGEVHELRQ